jgi:hypothetical protein
MLIHRRRISQPLSPSTNSTPTGISDDTVSLSPGKLSSLSNIMPYKGHPESGARWEKFVNAIIARHGFKSTTHERSLYQGTNKGHRMLICRHLMIVLSDACEYINAIKDLVQAICSDDGIDLRDEGVLNAFNNVDVHQTDRYIKVSCESYIDKLLAHYGWPSSGSRDTNEKPIEPLTALTTQGVLNAFHNVDVRQTDRHRKVSCESYIDKLLAHYGWSSSGSRDTNEKPIEPLTDLTTQQMFGDYVSAPRDGTAEYRDLEMAAEFSYRSVLGALIYAYVVSRPDIGYAVTTLARFSDHPAKIHYDALRRVARYLRMTKNWGKFYWRQTLIPSLPPGTFQPLVSDPTLPAFPQPLSPTELAGYVDAAHATDLVTRRSITGLVFMFGGGPLAYKSKIQSTVSMSSTETEFLADVHAAKIAKYLRSILLELGYPQLGPTTLFEHNAASFLMVKASRPTPRARHIDIQQFALQKRKASQEIVLSHIPGLVNSADSLLRSCSVQLSTIAMFAVLWVTMALPGHLRLPNPSS